MKWFFLKIINKIKERKFIKHIEICILNTLYIFSSGFLSYLFFKSS